MLQQDNWTELTHNPSLVEKLRLFQEDPSSLVFVALAEEYRKAGFPNQSLEILREGAFFHTSLLSAWLGEARALTDLKRYAEALVRCAQILQKAPEHVKALQQRVEIFLLLGQKSAALKSLRQIANLFPDDPHTKAQIAELVGLEENILAPKVARTEASLRDTMGRVSAYQVGRLGDFYSDDQHEAPVNELPLEATVELEDTFATRTIAELYLRQGLRAKAISVLRRMQQQNPADQWVTDTLLGTTGKPLPTQINDVMFDHKTNLAKKAKYLERALAYIRLGSERTRSSYGH
jgi:predicted Zn-dependent protease